MKVIDIDDINAILYYDFSPGYVFKGESHKHWELVYVDQGEVVIDRSGEDLVLKAGQLLVHYPNEFHAIKNISQSSAHVFIIGFSSESECLIGLTKGVNNISHTIKSMFEGIYKEASQGFVKCHVNSEGFGGFVSKKSKPIGCEQVIVSTLELLLISVLRQTDQTNISDSYNNPSILHEIEELILENIREDYTLTMLSRDMRMSKRKIQYVISNMTGGTFSSLKRKIKISEAKALIRSKNYSMTEIADMLSYSSLQYFSKQFKDQVSMTPIEYAHSIKVNQTSFTVKRVNRNRGQNED